MDLDRQCFTRREETKWRFSQTRRLLFNIFSWSFECLSSLRLFWFVSKIFSFSFIEFHRIKPIHWEKKANKNFIFGRYSSIVTNWVDIFVQKLGFHFVSSVFIFTSRMNFLFKEFVDFSIDRSENLSNSSSISDAFRC